MDKMKKKILEAFIRDGILNEDALTLREYEEKHPNDSWEYDTLEEFLADQYTEDEEECLREGKESNIRPGDIIFVNRYITKNGTEVSKSERSGTIGHKIMVITSVEIKDNKYKYVGFALTSNTDNSNQVPDGHPNKLYIKDYSTILKRGPRVNKKAAINVDGVVTCTTDDLSSSGVWKGHVTDEFFKFVQSAYSNYKSGKDNSQMRWEK